MELLEFDVIEISRMLVDGEQRIARLDERDVNVTQLSQMHSNIIKAMDIRRQMRDLRPKVVEEKQNRVIASVAVYRATTQFERAIASLISDFRRVLITTEEQIGQ